MIEKNKIYYTYNDITLIPNYVSEITHRSECNPFLSDNKLPIFTAPMSSVVNLENFNIFEENKINAILPRNIDFDIRIDFAINGKWAAFSLNEFEKYFCEKIDNFANGNDIKVLIDIANGHIQKMSELVKLSKNIYGDRIKIMIGNIANPETYSLVAQCGADYVRCGIGGGCGCFSKDTSVTLSDGTKKKINEIVVGDKVRTLHGNEYVLSTKEVYSEKLIQINKEIKCTSNHKFLVIRKEDKEKITDKNLDEFAFYVEAEKLDKNIHLLVKNV